MSNSKSKESRYYSVSFRLNNEQYLYVYDRMKKFGQANMSETVRSIIDLFMHTDEDNQSGGEFSQCIAEQRTKAESYDNLKKYFDSIDAKLDNLRSGKNEEDISPVSQMDFDDPPVIETQTASLPKQDPTIAKLSKKVNEVNEIQKKEQEKNELKTRWSAVAIGPNIRDGSCKFLADCNNNHNEMVEKIRAELDYWNERGWALTTKQIIALDSRIEIYNKKIHASLHYEGLKKFLYDTAIKNEKFGIPVDDISFTPMNYWKAIGGRTAPDDEETEVDDA